MPAHALHSESSVEGLVPPLIPQLEAAGRRPERRGPSSLPLNLGHSPRLAFTLTCPSLPQLARLDTCVTVVDAASLLLNMASIETVAVRGGRPPPLPPLPWRGRPLTEALAAASPQAYQHEAALPRATWCLRFQRLTQPSAQCCIPHPVMCRRIGRGPRLQEASATSQTCCWTRHAAAMALPVPSAAAN